MLKRGINSRVLAIFLALQACKTRDACRTTSECASGSACFEGLCRRPCMSKSACRSEEICTSRNFCALPPSGIDASGAPEISAILGDVAETGRVRSGLVIQGTHLDSVTEVNLLDEASQLVEPLILERAAATALIVHVPLSIGLTNVATLYFVQVVNPAGAAARDVQFLQGEHGADGVPGPTGAQGPPGSLNFPNTVSVALSGPLLSLSNTGSGAALSVPSGHVDLATASVGLPVRLVVADGGEPMCNGCTPPCTLPEIPISGGCMVLEDTTPFREQYTAPFATGCFAASTPGGGFCLRQGAQLGGGTVNPDGSDYAIYALGYKCTLQNVAPPAGKKVVGQVLCLKVR